MLRRSLALLAAASTLALPALAWDDPVANEIQSRMMEQQQRSIDEFVADQQAWGGEDDEDYAYDEPPAYSEEEWMAWAAEGDSAAAARLADDPAYQAFVNGQWLHVPPAKARKDACSVMFLRGGVGAMILATGDAKDPAILAFFGRNVPKPAKLVETRATLSQTGASPATVRVFNATLPWLDGYGIVFFAVPSLQAAIDGMVEAQAFDVAMDGQSVVEVAWTGGLGARDQLSACISARR